MGVKSHTGPLPLLRSVPLRAFRGLRPGMAAISRGGTSQPSFSALAGIQRIATHTGTHYPDLTSVRFSALAGIQRIATASVGEPAIVADTTVLVFQCPCGHSEDCDICYGRSGMTLRFVFQCPCGHSEDCDRSV